jgi:hypothetical protein
MLFLAATLPRTSSVLLLFFLLLSDEARVKPWLLASDWRFAAEGILLRRRVGDLGASGGGICLDTKPEVDGWVLRRFMGHDF